jgi:hypothetical protein
LGLNDSKSSFRIASVVRLFRGNGLRIHPLHVEGPRAWAKAEIGGKRKSYDVGGNVSSAQLAVIARCAATARIDA